MVTIKLHKGFYHDLYEDIAKVCILYVFIELERMGHKILTSFLLKSDASLGVPFLCTYVVYMDNVHLIQIQSGIVCESRLEPVTPHTPKRMVLGSKFKYHDVNRGI